MGQKIKSEKILKLKDSIDESLPTPLYHQIYVLIREKIFAGDYTDGSLIPTENELEKMFGVSRITVKRALDELAAEGLVSRQRGRGTTVTFKTPVSTSSAGMEGLLEDLLTIALETQVKILEFDYISAPPQATDALGLEANTTVQKAVRVRSKDKTPFSYAITYVPEDMGRSYSYDELSNQPLLALLERAGANISHARQTITATLADSKTGSALQVNIGSPLLKVTRIVYDSDNRAVEYITIFYRPDVYQMKFGLARVKGEKSNFWATDRE